MHSTKKNNQHYFAMKIHIGTDRHQQQCYPHSYCHSSQYSRHYRNAQLILRPDDKVVFADAGYVSDSYKHGARALGMTWKVNDKRKPKKQLSSRQKKRN